MFNSSFGKLSMTRPAFYIPEPHHTLRDVITHSYGIRQGNEPLFSTLLEYLVALNPEIKNSRTPLGWHIPRTLDIISGDPVSLLCTNPELVKARIREVLYGGGQFAKVDQVIRNAPSDPQERQMFEFLARASSDTQHISDFAGVGLGVLGHLSGPHNQILMTQLEQLNRQRLEKKISVRQYQLRQQAILNDYLHRISWLGRHMHGGQNAFNALYQNRAVGINPSPVFAQHASRMARLSSLAKGGGVLLTAFGAAATCGKIAVAESAQKKNEIFFIDAAGIIGGVGGGYAASIAVGLLVASGPVGWGLALGASLIGGYFAQGVGKASGKFFYDQFGEKLDLASSSGVSRLCN